MTPLPPPSETKIVRLRIDEVVERSSQYSGKPYIAFKFTTLGEPTGKHEVYFNASLHTPNLLLTQLVRIVLKVPTNVSEVTFDYDELRPKRVSARLRWDKQYKQWSIVEFRRYGDPWGDYQETS